MNDFIWALAVFFFVGMWVEITLNFGLVGLVLGWFPAMVSVYVFLHITGRMKVN